MARAKRGWCELATRWQMVCGLGQPPIAVAEVAAVAVRVGLAGAAQEANDGVALDGSRRQPDSQ